MNQSPFILLLLLTASCASNPHNNPKTVQFPYALELLEKVQKSAGRMPASLVQEGESDRSPRRVYFSALYHQYLTLGEHLGNKSAINFCPQFHHDKLETDAGIIPKVTVYQTLKMEGKDRAFFPELAFSKDFSLADYLDEIQSEISILCEDGVSDNFYKFDNLITHYSQRDAFHKHPGAMASVLKIPVFANFYLVKMLQIAGPGDSSPEERRFIRLTKTYWFENYVTEAHRVRNSFIKNKMVRR
jgi:hypothetical protein